MAVFPSLVKVRLNNLDMVECTGGSQSSLMLFSRRRGGRPLSCRQSPRLLAKGLAEYSSLSWLNEMAYLGVGVVEEEPLFALPAHEARVVALVDTAVVVLNY